MRCKGILFHNSSDRLFSQFAIRQQSIHLIFAPVYELTCSLSELLHCYFQTVQTGCASLFAIRQQNIHLRSMRIVSPTSSSRSARCRAVAKVPSFRASTIQAPWLVAYADQQRICVA